MQETPQQYTQRILDNVRGEEPLKVLSATSKKLDRFLGKASTAKLRRRPAPDKWSVGEILAHLADAEIVLGWRVRSILGAPGTPIQAFDQNAWAKAGRYEQRNPRQSVAQFSAIRAANLALYKSLSPEQWKLCGVHSERGRESIELIIRMMAGHDLNHVKQIEGILSGK